MLGRFIDQHMTRAWSPGDTDCILALADWCVELGYSDPAADLRGTYDDEIGFQAIIDAAGGVVPLIDSRAALIGVERAALPEIGFVAVIGSPANVSRQWGAIWNGSGWSVRFKDAYPSCAAHALAIWRTEKQ
ncbi:hypothetical protein [Mesorhizobium sp. RMAD-H1]|uniref:DUF6950 family protein n=1 Tax=Mesorhizobium sp. RMAD-H1 TaxID=2587065 RepID=UPI001FEEE1DD|nr:hypothetical protein [Mesorhizobium sp. RMAD-H1]